MQEDQQPRDLNIELGSIVFVYQRDRDEFRFGNVESRTPRAFCVSFEQADWSRRDPPVEVPFDDLILPAEFNARKPTANHTYKTKEVVLKKTSHDTVEALALVATQEETGHPLLVARVVFRPESGWIMSGDPFVVQAGEVHHPLVLDLVQRYRFCAPVHPLFDILRQPAGLMLDVTQAAILRLRDVEIPVDATLKIKGHVVDIHVAAHYALSRLLGGVRSEFLVDESLAPRLAVDPCWEALVAVSGSSQKSGDFGYAGTISVIPRTVTVTYRDEPVVATADTYIGAPFNAWSHLAWRREAPIPPPLVFRQGPLPNAVFFLCFGSPAVMQQPDSYEGSQDTYLSIVRLGDALTAEEHAVLSVFVGYITGGRARNVLTETFSSNVKLRTIIHDRGLPTRRKCPPIPVDNAWGYAPLMTRHFSDMLDVFKRWRQTDARSFDAVFHHYAEGVDSTYPVTRTLRLSIALEAFINLITQDKAENENIVDNGSFQPLKAALKNILEEYCKANRSAINDNAEARYVTKLEGFNTGSNTKRIDRFWELVPITLQDEDRKLLRRLRNDSTHRGYLGGAGDEEDPLGDAEDANRLCDILNRAILYSAGYSGPVLSAESGRWVDSRTGELFKVPPRTDGGTITIEHRLPVPALSPEESAAAERLRDMQREPQADAFFEIDENLAWPVDD